MAVTVKISFVGQDALQRALSKIRMPELAKPVSRFLLKAGFRVLANASEKQIIAGGRFRGPGGPRGGLGALRDSPPHPSRLTSRTGELRRSLGANRGLDKSGLPGFVEVGSDLVYAPVHELGLGRFPRRRFLEPAFDEESPAFENMLADEIEAELAKL